MRKRVVRVAVVAVLVALVLLATPLAVVIQQSFFADERAELERAALAAAVRVGPKFAVGDRVELPVPERDARLGVYDRSGHLRDGTGPRTADPVSRRATTGVVTRGHSGHELVVAVPVSSSERTVGLVRASARAQGVWRRVILAWLGLVGTALAALATGVLVARRQARTLTAPLESLSTTAEAVAGGDMTARAEGSAIAEIDQVARTQNTMVEHLTRLLEHERRFSANASHQLRTPLAGLQLGLEAAAGEPGADLREAVDEALAQARHLQRTVDEVLRLARAAPGAYVPTTSRPASEVIEGVERRWHGPLAAEGRRLGLSVEPGSETLRIPDRTAEQILDVLLDNARRHGRGAVEVTVREISGAVAVDVTDEGSLALDPRTVFERGATTSRSGSGIGLTLAREMAEAAGGRLTLARAAPTTFTLLLPAAEPPPPRG
ncbi:HAMP domain-containing sensor histidine kinase [Streptomyces sp. DASNCL29]|uniref:sensor histidine kinase n=1 Tax=Streptomyces sp. DASNCL29 TaxID=2583819 RepID=UPI00110FE6C2|nr:HAMP domain-containing sensor histidine kinase [Streptomyces sp. DASNCL29]TMU92889.1 HAMP domain-containing histidine kinase [Streptomyces sp. DASNCL29]